MAKGGTMAQKEVKKPPEEAPKIKVVPKKPLPTPKKIPKKEEKTKEKLILEEIKETKEAIDAWYKLLAHYCWNYLVIFKKEEDVAIDTAILELRAQGDGGYFAANELLDYGRAIINKIQKLDSKIVEADMLGKLVGNKDYQYVSSLQGNALYSAVEAVEEQLGLKESGYLKKVAAGLQADFDKYKKKKLIDEVPVISAMKGPMPTPAEEAELHEKLTNPHKMLCAQFGPSLCKPGEYKMSKKEKIESLEMMILLIPVVGPVYGLGMTAKRIKGKADIIKEANRLDDYLEKNAGTMSADEIIFVEEQVKMLREAAGDWKSWATEGAFIVMDLAFLGLDVTFIGSFAVKTGAKWVGRDAAAVIKAEAQAGKIITKVEKDLMAKALLEFSEDEMKHLLVLAKEKGSMRKVFEEIANLAGDGTITTKVMKTYLKKNPLPQLGALKKAKKAVNEFAALEDGLSMFSKSKFRTRVVTRFYTELLPNIDFGVVKELSELMAAAKLGKSEKYAVDAILHTALSFDKAPQKALLKGLKEGKFTWPEIISSIKTEEKALIEAGTEILEGDTIRGMAARNVLKKMLPEYNLAYMKAPFDHWLKIGIFIGGTHIGLVHITDYIEAKSAEERKKAEEILFKLTESEEAEALIDMYMKSLAAGGI